MRQESFKLYSAKNGLKHGLVAQMSHRFVEGFEDSKELGDPSLAIFANSQYVVKTNYS